MKQCWVIGLNQGTWCTTHTCYVNCHEDGTRVCPGLIEAFTEKAVQEAGFDPDTDESDTQAWRDGYEVGYKMALQYGKYDAVIMP